MKTLLKAITLAAGFAVAALPAVRAADESAPAPAPAPDAQTNPDAQPNRPQRWRHRMDPARMLQHMTEVLSLTADQQAKAKPILEAGAAQRRSIMEDDSLSREDRRAKMMDAMKDERAKIRALLTPDQQKKFDEMRPRGRRFRGEGPGGDQPPPPPPDNPPSGAGA